MASAFGASDVGVEEAAAVGSALEDLASCRVDAADGQLAVRHVVDLSRARKHIDNNHSFYFAGPQAHMQP